MNAVDNNSYQPCLLRYFQMELTAETQYTCKGSLIGDYKNKMHLGSAMGSNCREFFWALFILCSF
jgi:hypothetical protein